MDGWIKLHRKLMESESFYKLTAVQKLIAIYIVLNANHEDGIWYDKYKGIEVEVKRGQLVTSRNKIVNEWFNKDKDVTEQRVRTCLDKLVRINFITKSPANDYTLITVVNYDIYQSKKEDDNQAVTKSQPSGNQAITTNKNDKNDKKVKRDSPKQVYDESSLPYRTANYLYTNILKHKPDLKQPNIQTWANDMRKLIEIDNRDPAEIGRVIEWATKDSFWQSNILSASKLREKWDTLTVQMKNKTISVFPNQTKADRDAEQRNAMKQKIIGGMSLEDIESTRGRADITTDQNSVPFLRLE